jgi:hypothetical protein
MRNCRKDNGICFRALKFKPEVGQIIAEFSDGSLYVLWGATREELEGGQALIKDVGCWFNRDLKLRDSYRYRRLRGPQG